jgi:16S rRNA (guanine527-N7)-methyltransferase
MIDRGGSAPSSQADAEPTSRLVERLRDAQQLGLLGPGPVEPHLLHAQGLAATVVRALGDPPGMVVDLGSGAGIPGLVLACSWEGARVVLVEAGARRAAHLQRSIEVCGLTGRVKVENARAETVGRSAAYRGRSPVVVARSFGRPAVTAECAAPLLRPGGLLAVSEPPDEPGESRWPAGPLSELGLGPAAIVKGEFRFALLRQVSPCPERFPRRVGVPAKRPLF